MIFKRFKTPFSHNIFHKRYAQDKDDTWDALCERLVNDVCGDRSLCAKPNETPLLSREDQAQLVQYMKEMKFIPGGRYLYYAGRPVSFFNNCLTGDTLVMTKDGLLKLDSFSPEEKVEVLTRTGEYKTATFNWYGKRDVYKYEFCTVRGCQQTIKEVKATENHRWFLTDGSVTTNLKIGDVVPATPTQYAFNKEAFIHGLVFGDGNVHYLKSHFSHQLRLCGIKNRFVDLFKEEQISYPQFANGDAVLYITSKKNLKELPEGYSMEYIANFIDGWLSADGCQGQFGNMIHTTSEQAIDFFIQYACYAGLVITGDKKCETKPSNFGDRKPLWHVRFQRAESFLGFKVKSISYYGLTDVYCFKEPKTTSFTLQGGMTTGNCFAFKSGEDSREEWGRLANNATVALMSGGGIGNDYSVFRPRGRTLSKTGGIASGPIPLMHMINEVGRNVMQGGSRRSAIYASLNWQHEDIQDFLVAKDWSDDIRRLKLQDFNFPAPLDMTNISINWDTKFIKDCGPFDCDCGICSYCNGVKKWQDDVPQLWYDSVLKMCQTGEPGHSYNFWENENETGRNACTEFTTEDDSDVCNLGSINLGNISSLDELKSVVGLASKFLVCGSIRGDLPYEKVKRVREQNRKIGLGLMGVHEWLLQRGYKYEVNDELKGWLDVWRSESETAANEHCDRFYINRPKKYRAIAPAGTIGILASTTTGIEPIYAVATKRRYLDGGKTWKYEYVIDATSERLIREFGIEPDSIETSAGLARDPERRIKFQYDIQKYVDMAISSTINLPVWGSKSNNETTAKNLADILLKYCHGLRGITVYPDGSRGGQPLTEVSYEEALKKHGQVYAEENTCSGGVCGI